MFNVRITSWIANISLNIFFSESYKLNGRNWKDKKYKKQNTHKPNIQRENILIRGY